MTLNLQTQRPIRWILLWKTRVERRLEEELIRPAKV
ncbi:unnamed protein product [Medioppia subpectinata]|uniref:Uncharacterized protein n=1 Tax=Medioppia subpectinata TaxID=1979941 RepID=A0A7R9LZS3_9ACAR|nr:unnamed protein product [Medioppia subpectinata]CAG2123047.1 unnamed protein product [Medioppia subpectinata]